MKKIICLSLALLVMLSCLTACNFTQRMSGDFAGKAESASKVEEMMTALAENHTDDAKALMHSAAAEKSNDAIAQMITYLSGRKAAAIDMININVNTTTGTAGKIRQEQTSYQVTLTDGEVIYLNTTYLSNNDGNGFISFQLVLGLV